MPRTHGVQERPIDPMLICKSPCKINYFVSGRGIMYLSSAVYMRINEQRKVRYNEVLEQKSHFAG